MIIFPGPVVPADPVTVAIDGFLIGTQDEYGTQITLSDQSGWYGAPSVRHPGRAARPNQHGAFASVGYSDGRSVELSGNGFAPDAVAARRSVRALTAALFAPSTLSWFDPDTEIVLSAGVERDGEIQVSNVGDRIFEWSTVLFAPDNRSYGLVQSGGTSLPGGGTGLAYNLAYPLDYGDPGVPGRVQFTNTGTAYTEPSFTITPPLSVGFEITRVETGQRLRYEHPVGSELVLDCSAGTVMEAGQRRERYLTVREWPSVGPGETATFQFSTLGPETYLDPAHLSGQMAPAYP